MTRTEIALRAVIDELRRRQQELDAKEHLQQVTLVVKYDRQGKGRLLEFSAQEYTTL